MQSLTIRRQLFVVSLVVAGAIGLIVSVWWSALDKLKVNGPVYGQIVQLKDLVADILPPPEYIIESYLVASRALMSEPADIGRYQDAMESLKKEYIERHAFWQGQVLDPSLSEGLLVRSYQAASRFYETARQTFFPALLRGDKAAAEAAYRDMSQAYDAHRLAIDGVVDASGRLTRLTETAAADGERSYVRMAVLVTVGAVVLAMGSLIFIATTLGRRAKKLSARIKEIEQTSNLTLRANIRGSDEIAQTAQAFDAFMASIGEAVRSMTENARHVAEAAGQASAAVSQISEGSHHQLSALRQISIAMEQTAHAVNDVSENARTSSVQARKAADLVRTGDQQVDGMVAVVNAIAASSRQISKITEVISEIASQTNMLSLNASIEAARAGDAGRGFAVVAEEVGRLADHSGKSVADINSLTEKAASETSRGVEMSTAVKSSISQIAAGVAESDRMAEAIAAAMQQQRAAVTEIKASLNDLSLIGETNASAAEEINATVAGLASFADRATRDLERFKV